VNNLEGGLQLLSRFFRTQDTKNETMNFSDNFCAFWHLSFATLEGVLKMVETIPTLIRFLHSHCMFKNQPKGRDCCLYTKLCCICFKSSSYSANILACHKSKGKEYRNFTLPVLENSQISLQ